MARNFPDFIDAYFDYAKDSYVPDQFHKWIGISILAAAVERKVSLSQGPLLRYYPNVYVMLVSNPAMGKSTAINRGVDLLHAIRKDYQSKIRILPQQMTKASLIEEMKYIDYFPVGNSTILVPQSAGFFCHDEASDSALRNDCGDFVASMTALYDCPKEFSKSTVGRGKDVIENMCMNMLVGCTFDYLKSLVNESSVMGGFASRNIYVLAKDRLVRDADWDFKTNATWEMRNSLAADLAVINKLAGPMTVTPEFKIKWKDWHRKFDQELIDLKSEKLQSLLGRKNINTIKLAMLCSISESDSMILDAHHWDRAVELVESVSVSAPLILSKAIMGQGNTQAGINEAIKAFIMEAGGKITMQALRRCAAEHACDLTLFNKTLESWFSAAILKSENGYISIAE